MKKWKMILLAAAAAVVFGGCKKDVVYQLEEPKKSETVSDQKEGSDNENDSPPKQEGKPAVICVHVCGAVNRPGVYELPSGSRAAAAVEAAGGLSKEASQESLNQARLLEDGEQILVLTQQEIQAGAGKVSAVQEETRETMEGKININTADVQQLTSLNGIGEAKAAAIVKYREENGAFAQAEDICSVDGIGDKTFEKIRDQITVG